MPGAAGHVWRLEEVAEGRYGSQWRASNYRWGGGGLGK